jgi:hypothetical protein
VFFVSFVFDLSVLSSNGLWMNAPAARPLTAVFVFFVPSWCAFLLYPSRSPVTP